MYGILSVISQYMVIRNKSNADYIFTFLVKWVDI